MDKPLPLVAAVNFVLPSVIVQVDTVVVVTNKIRTTTSDVLLVFLANKEQEQQYPDKAPTVMVTTMAAITPDTILAATITEPAEAVFTADTPATKSCEALKPGAYLIQKFGR